MLHTNQVVYPRFCARFVNPALQQVSNTGRKTFVAVADGNTIIATVRSNVGSSVL